MTLKDFLKALNEDMTNAKLSIYYYDVFDRYNEIDILKEYDTFKNNDVVHFYIEDNTINIELDIQE